jgi:excisionase family DNA binding protein
LCQKEGYEVTQEILDAQEVADMLRLHPRTVMKLANQGQLRGFKAGGQWRFRREAVEEYIKEQEEKYSGQKSSSAEGTRIPPMEDDDQDKTHTS